MLTTMSLSLQVIFILKKSKLDRLRHHLMPLYNFDPMEEGGDWESELLEEDKEQQVALHIGVGNRSLFLLLAHVLRAVTFYGVH